MSSARNKLLASVDHIRTLKWVIAFLVVVVIGQWLRIGHLQEYRKIFIPPSLTQGFITSFDEVPQPVVYTFSLYILQQLNRWKEDGEQDYSDQIYRLQGFLTSGCMESLEGDMNNKRKLGELRSRERTLEELTGSTYEKWRVIVESNERWEVWLDVNVKETIAKHEVKNINLRYKIPVVRFDVDKEVNPWGLALACTEDTKPELLIQENHNEH